jgi:pyrophosphatase PpaX
MSAVLWDLDDTLLNTLPARIASLAHAYRVIIGTSVDPVELWRSNRGGTLEDLARRLVGSDYHHFCRTYRDHYYGRDRDSRPFDGVEAVLRSLHAAAIPMVVVTSKVSHGATEELATAGILQYFHSVVGFDDTDRHKPDPEPVYAALDRLLADRPERVVFVGDSPADIWAARNAGVTAVAALWGTLDAAALLDAAPDFTAQTPGQVLELLAEKGLAR